MITGLKKVEFEGDSREIIAGFPQPVRYDLGRQIFRLQEGQEPDDWRSFKTAGAGCREIRVWDETGTYRAVYVLLVANRVHVLHAFQKKSEKTAQRDVNTASERYRALKRRIEDGKKGKI